MRDYWNVDRREEVFTEVATDEAAAYSTLRRRLYTQLESSITHPVMQNSQHSTRVHRHVCAWSLSRICQVSFASRPGLVIKLYCLQDFTPKLYCLQVLRSAWVNVSFTSLLITQEFRCFKISKLCYICLTGVHLWPEYPCVPALANKLLVGLK